MKKATKGTPLWKALFLEGRLPWRYQEKIMPFLNLIYWYYPIIYDIQNYLKDKSINQKKFTEKLSKSISLVYFSCSNHFEYLICSLKSLEKLNLDSLGYVFLYIDKKNPLSKKQISIIKEIKLNFIFKKTKYSMSHGNVKLLINELVAFKEIASDLSEGSYIGKTDSDVLFISDNIFKYVLESTEDMIGQPHEHNIKNPDYIQGGCYFLKKSMINKLGKIKLNKILRKIINVQKKRKDIMKEFAGLFKLQEDYAIFNLVKKCRGNIKFVRFHLPPGNINKIIKNYDKYSLIHFWNGDKRCKDDMSKIYKKFFV